MSKDDLLKLLDLGGTEAARSSDPLSVVLTGGSQPKVSASPTALELDDWALRRGRDLLNASDRLQGLEVGEHAVADFHACAFEPEPKLLDACEDDRRHEFVKQLLDTPEYRSLHTSTMLNLVASEIAAAAFAEQFADLKNKEAEEGPKDADPADREMATLRAVGRALAKAGEEVEEMKETAAALGLGPGNPGSNDPKTIAELFRRVRSDAALRRICELAGRYRRLAQSRQRRKLVHGSDDMVGVVMDGDVGRLLPHELAKLVMLDLEDDVLRRLVERQCMCREYRSSEPVAKGPIIVCVDESGSMQGENVHTAKALALAMAWVARQQKRWVALVAYSGDSGERLLALPPGEWDEPALMDWLTGFIGCGSDLDVPVRELPRYYEELKAPRGVTDVLFLTDAKCRIKADVREAFLAWKHDVKARLISLVIANEPGDLVAISDEAHQVESLAVTEEAVGKALSV